MATPVVSHAAAMLVQVPAPAGERSKPTEATPLPPVSVDVEFKLTVPLRYWPGSSIVATGGTVSTTHVCEAGEGSTFPPTSVARTSKVWEPSPSEV